ncbi:AdoMet dependent proline di-methyltransferase-domain-containing protein [Xylariaceae sp. FL0804]|nr:AdoMet dependent proline di-methyltransferase-domain-containing protein [Xylariaceae sp. FL0804]
MPPTRAATAAAAAADPAPTTTTEPGSESGSERDEAGAAAAADSRISAADGRQYWAGIASDDDGMLGGYARISRVDLRASRSFVAKLGLGRAKGGGRAVRRAMEGGAGIGRITRGLLLDIAETVDVVEPMAHFTAALEGVPGVGAISNVGLEEWRAADDYYYDLIWNQWCLGHLTDRQLEAYLGRCRAALSSPGAGAGAGAGAGGGGVIVVKENLSTGEDDIFDATDSSVTRRDDKFRAIFDRAGLRIVKTELQHGFPSELYPVRTYALKPKDTAAAAAAASAVE